jgi:hypothetical protein
MGRAYKAMEELDKAINEFRVVAQEVTSVKGQNRNTG